MDKNNALLSPAFMVGEPRILLFDEPTRGLDARLRQTFYDVLRKTRERLRVPLVLVTHDLEECFELADSVFLLDRGRFVQSGSRELVFQRACQYRCGPLPGCV